MPHTPAIAAFMHLHAHLRAAAAVREPLHRALDLLQGIVGAAPQVAGVLRASGGSPGSCVGAALGNKRVGATALPSAGAHKRAQLFACAHGMRAAPARPRLTSSTSARALLLRFGGGEGDAGRRGPRRAVLPAISRCGGRPCSYACSSWPQRYQGQPLSPEKEGMGKGTNRGRRPGRARRGRREWGRAGAPLGGRLLLRQQLRQVGLVRGRGGCNRARALRAGGSAAWLVAGPPGLCTAAGTHTRRAVTGT